MIRWFLNRKLDSVEKQLGVPLDESRYLLKHSVKAFLSYAKVSAIAHYRGPLPRDVYYAAKIAAYRQEDCGSCLQITVNLARKSGVAPELIRTLLSGNVAALPAALRDVFRFAEDQANRQDDPALREHLRELYGDEGLIALALAITSARLFPTFKRATGYATSCAVTPIQTLT